MSNLEPTYLRYIYDGLVKGSVHPENAAELPDGLIGLYEEAFDESISAVDRKKRLERFAIWALLKKEVSADFVAEVLGDSEDDIQDFISTYSSWFNSPESGKYQLYHERLKVFLLQKLSEVEVSSLNNLIIVKLNACINQDKRSEIVLYCYEFLSFHLFIGTYLGNNSDQLAEICLQNEFKKKQFEISGFYNWEELLMSYGIQFFSIKQDEICHQLVFEKTKIRYKKKDIKLILELAEKGEFELVFSFFKSSEENLLEERIVLVYFYVLTFFKIFENKEMPFKERKDAASLLLQIFEENFKWDKGYYLAQFIDVNVSFRLHCYFLQFGLDFTKYAILSSDHKADFFTLNTEGNVLKFVDSKHTEEAFCILNEQKEIYDYSFDNSLINSLTKVEDQIELSDLTDEHKNKLVKYGKHRLFNQGELGLFIEDEVTTFNQLISSLVFCLGFIELPRQYKIEALNEFKNCIENDSSGLLIVSGHLHRNDLKIVKNVLTENQMNSDQHQLIELFTIESFSSLDSISRFNLLNKIVFQDELEVDLLVAFLDLGNFYDSLKNKDIYDLFSALFVEFTLDTDESKINKYQEILFESFDGLEHHTEDFENQLFGILIHFFQNNNFNGHSKSTLEQYKDTIFNLFFDFNFYNYSFKQGIALINLYNHYQIDFQEEEVVERILEDIDFMIDENDYNEMWVIETSRINNIYDKPYFALFYDKIKCIQIEQVRNDLSKYIFADIIEKKGVNYQTVLYFKENATEFPGMYSWAIKRLSMKLFDLSPVLSYLPICHQNELLLERLLLNILSSRNKLKEDLNIQILNYYNLSWLSELDNEYEKLIKDL
jgi:hypothetical protein